MTPRTLLETLGLVALTVVAALTAVYAVAAHAEWVERRDRAAWERGPCVCECGGGE